MITLEFLAVTLVLIGMPATAMVLIGRKVTQPRTATPASFEAHAAQACAQQCECHGCVDARWLDELGELTERAMTGRVRWIGGGSDA